MAVDVATGSRPDHLDHRHERTVPSGQTVLRLPRDATGRLFVSVAPHDGGSAVVATDRRVPFEGVTNFRDIGGYQNAFRSAGPAGVCCFEPTRCMACRPAIVFSTIGSASLPCTTCAERWNAKSGRTPFRPGNWRSSVAPRTATGRPNWRLQQLKLPGSGSFVISMSALSTTPPSRSASFSPPSAKTMVYPRCFTAMPARTAPVSSQRSSSTRSASSAPRSSTTMASQPATAGGPIKSPLTSASSNPACPKKPPLAYWRRRGGPCSMPLMNWTVATAAWLTIYGAPQA